MLTLDKPSWLPIYAKDFSADGSMPSDWDIQILKLASMRAVETILDGESPTSLEEVGTKIPIRVVMGEVVFGELPWLYHVYESEMLAFASNAFGTALYKCNRVDDSININSVSGISGRYEWHLDTNPVTGLLFAETLEEEEGGALVFRKFGEEFRIQPKRGMFYCFDAREVPHAVEPLRVDRTRTSVPMNYYLTPDNSGRDDQLNEYLRKG